MLPIAEMTQLFETVLLAPGMNEVVKVDLKLQRKHVLLLNKVIERGLLKEDGNNEKANLLNIVTKETIGELQVIASEILEKAGLKEMNEKLNSFQ